ncbi:complement factor D-like protein [Labeo rohita]|uniref:trypsin n=1 Tax=Labeo rohita TaxID=84645 RepID=A0A498NGU7_LABRO|nr:complement factor D-like protein [Labeo rohita]
MTIISLLLLASLLPHLTFTARVKVGIVNGTEAKPHSRPYMVSIQKNIQNNCGGFLTSDQWVLTAAHCWKSKSSLIVFMMTIISLLLLTSLLPHLTFTAHVKVGIVNGTEAKPHSRPYMVSIQENKEHICGGFLISDEFVLTAAHCWKGHPQILTIVVGAHDIKRKKNLYRVGVKSYIPHPNYITIYSYVRNDIMLLRLQKKVNLSKEIQEVLWFVETLQLVSLPFKTSMIVFIMTIISLLPHLTFTAHVNVGIVHGTEVKPHSRPFMVSLQKDCKHICGGFLISDRFVMTAAHCRKKNEKLTAVVGAHDLEKINEGSIRIGVNTYHGHPDFNNHTFQNDIMLLRQEKEVEQNEKVMKISIPTREGDIKADSACSVASWGRLSLNRKESKHLMEAEVRVMNNTECKNKWKYMFSASNMMSVHGHGGSCKGDGGGPLVCGDTAVGITSITDSKVCNRPDRPEVYIKISAYGQWICSIIANVK